MGLAGFERRLERLFEGGFARAFKSGVEPVELGRRLTREMDRSRQRTVKGVIVPNVFAYRLSPADLSRFASYADTLVKELEQAARDHARDEGYTVLGAVEVSFNRDARQGPGAFAIQATVVASPDGRPVAALLLPGGRRFRLGAAPIALGRLEPCEVLLDDLTVSRRHAEVRPTPDGNGYEIGDLQSQNGTRVNGAVVVVRRLRDGDELHLGAVALRYEGP